MLKDASTPGGSRRQGEEKRDDRRGYHAGAELDRLGVIFRDDLDSFGVTMSQIR